MPHLFTLTETLWQSQSAWPLLSILQLLPLLMALFALVLRRYESLVKLIALLTTGVVLALVVDLYQGFDSHTATMQYAEHWSFLPGYHAAIDGVSLLFILLTAFISAMLVVYSLARQIDEMSKLLPAILAIEAAMMTLFTTLNLLWFTFFSAVELVLVAYLLSHWASSPEKDLARNRYIQFMLVALLLLFAGVMTLGWNYADMVTGATSATINTTAVSSQAGQWSFDLFDLLKAPIPMPLQSVIFFLLFYGLAIRIPMFPLHGWLPVFTTHGNVALAPAVMLGIKVGVYGMLRFVLTLTPEAILHWQKYIIAFAVAGVFYAAILAFMQKNLRRLLAFAVISHTSILVIGLYSLGDSAFQGSVLLAANFGLATVALVFMAGFVFRRSKSLLLSHLGGLFDTIPLIGWTFLIAGLAIVGMPGTPGFDAVHLVLEAAMEHFGAVLTVIAALGNVIAAGFLLWSFQRAFLTPREAPVSASYLEKTTWGERLVAVLLLSVSITVGFYSRPWLELIEAPLQHLSTVFDTNLVTEKVKEVAK